MSKHLRHGVVAMFFFWLCGTAMAGPIYRITLDTGGLSGTGWLDLQFNPGPGAAPGLATVSNFAGALDTALVPLGDGAVSGSLPGTLVMANTTAFNAVLQALVLGGSFSFDVQFSGGAGALFALGLYGPDQMTPFGSADPFTGTLLQIGLGEGQGVVLSDAALAAVQAVPEPDGLLLLAIGLAALMAAAASRRYWRGR